MGDRIPKTQHVVFKMRVKNRDIQKGKSAGYRLIYWIREPGFVVLVTIYSKLDQEDVSPEHIRRVINEFEKSGS